MQFAGIMIAGVTILLVGLGHIWVRKVKNHLGSQAWPFAALIGGAVTFSSLLLPEAMISAAAGILGSTILWGAWELVEKPTAPRRQENLHESRRFHAYLSRK